MYMLSSVRLVCPSVFPSTQRLCVPAPQTAELPECEEDGCDEEGDLLLRRSPPPHPIAARLPSPDAGNRVRDETNVNKRTNASCLRRLLTMCVSVCVSVCLLFVVVDVCCLKNLHRKASGRVDHQYPVTEGVVGGDDCRFCPIRWQPLSLSFLSAL